MKLPAKYQPWVDARTRYRLSDEHIQMARELGLNPKKLGGLANHRQEPWKLPLPDFIAGLYQERFGKQRPDETRPLEEIVAEKKRRKAEKKAMAQAEPIRQPPPGKDALTRLSG
jgi:hypothetical protein